MTAFYFTNHREKPTVMAIRKKETSTAWGIVKRHKENLDTKNTKAVTYQTALLTAAPNTVNNLQNSAEREKPENSGSESAVIDTKRVKAIRRAIQKGEYRINCKRTAEKLLQLEDEIWGDD